MSYPFMLVTACFAGLVAIVCGIVIDAGIEKRNDEIRRRMRDAKGE